MPSDCYKPVNSFAAAKVVIVCKVTKFMGQKFGVSPVYS